MAVKLNLMKHQATRVLKEQLSEEDCGAALLIAQPGPIPRSPSHPRGAGIPWLGSFEMNVENDTFR